MVGGDDNRVVPWGTIPDDTVQVITSRSDPLSLSRFARVVPGISDAVGRVAPIPFDLPCLLHSNPTTWPNDRSSDDRSTDASMMPLDNLSMPASVILEKDWRWAGYRRNWVAIVCDMEWKLMNLVTGVSFTVPSIEDAGFKPEAGPFIFLYEDMAMAELLKIQIIDEPYITEACWSYNIIAVFNTFIAFLQVDGGDNDRWKVLSNDFLDPEFYRDAVWISGRIFAVSDAGNVFTWDPYSYGTLSR